jgi:GT2 family glycosyltransferase
MNAEEPLDVLVVIVVWNGLEDTLECLESLRRCEFSNKRILVVDNGSTDGSSATISANYPEVSVVRSERNLGFTGGNNLGMLEAIRHKARYAFLLNNDTKVAPDALRCLVRHAETDPRSALLAPVIHYYEKPDEIWFAGARINLSRGEALHQNVADIPVAAPPFATGWISGCAMLVRMVAVTAVGMFDSRFYLTWEDVDWCLRMRECGHRVVVVPASRILHKGGRSGQRLSGVHLYYAVRNSLLVVRKHGGSAYAIAVFCILMRYARNAVRSGSEDRASAFRSVILGAWHHVRGKYGPAPALGAG